MTSPPKAARSAWSSLRTALLLATVALLPVGLLAASSITLASDQVRREVDKRVQATAAVTAVVVAQKTTSLAAIVHSYATRPDLAASVAAGPEGATVTTAQLQGLIGGGEGLSAAFITDVTGTLTAVEPPAPAVMGRNFAHRDWFTGLAQTGGPYVSNAYQTALDGHPLVVGVSDYIRGPDGAPIAVVAAIFSLDAIRAFSANIASAEDITLTIADRAGTSLSQGGQDGLISLSSDPRVIEAGAGRSGLLTYTPDLPGGGRRPEELSAYAPVGNTGWAVVAAVPHARAFAGLERLRSTVAGITAVLVLVVLAGVAVIARAQETRREWELQTRRQDKELARVIDSTDEAFVSIDRVGAITAWSAKAESLFGWTAAEAVGRPLTETIIPVAQRRGHRHGLGRYSGDAPSAIVGKRVELSAMHRDGHEVPVELAVWAHEDGAGFSGFVHDISERVSIQAELEATRDNAMQASRLKSEFLATMSHEIRTPMNAVIGMTGLLLDTDLDAQQQEFCATVRDSGEALLGVINDILDFSKIEAGDLELEAHPFELRDCVEGALALVAFSAGNKGLELVAEFDESCPDLVIGDVTRFRQVIVNLLSNAVKFTAAGEVLVAVSARGPAGVEAGGPVEVVVAVTDTGIGIPEDGMHRLFQPFSQADSSTTRNYGGTGLGLVISRRLAEAMRGALDVTSEVGVGSTFTFRAALTRSTDRRPAPELPAGTLDGKTALMVDDNATNLRVLQLTLERWGMTCTQASTPAAALELLSSGCRADVAVLDMHMPGMDGTQLAAAIREMPSRRELPLVLLTSLQWRLTPEAKALFAATLSKPAKTTVLQEKLLIALGSPDQTLHAVETAGGRRSGDGPAVAPLPPARLDAVAEVRALSPLRVLLAEDNPVNQKVAQLILAKLGYRVDTVSNGREAVDAVRRAPYDVVLMDVQMPELDGIDATRVIRAELGPQRQPRIVAMTASVLIEDRTACAAAGMDSYLTKPIRPAELGSVLAAIERSAPVTPTVDIQA